MNLKDTIIAAALLGGLGDSAVDIGYYIAWDLDKTGRDVATVNGEPMLYKVSDAVFSASRLVGCECETTLANISVHEETVISGEHWSAIVADGTPVVISAKAGRYVYGNLSVDIPTDGIYFFSITGDIPLGTKTIYRPATE